eukprot:TRINITY_DN4915_c3_g1_i1.p1 TRINITY_DN4915_c3_g1~~TRINITY_DN4915_c3_g1_i1.p1  ORF type:complete len:1361 (+),score=475.85 TRINITY_DN4915_c3_g1_i1:50-4132(+)
MATATPLRCLSSGSKRPASGSRFVASVTERDAAVAAARDERSLRRLLSEVAARPGSVRKRKQLVQPLLLTSPGAEAGPQFMDRRPVTAPPADAAPNDRALTTCSAPVGLPARRTPQPGRKQHPVSGRLLDLNARMYYRRVPQPPPYEPLGRQVVVAEAWRPPSAPPPDLGSSSLVPAVALRHDARTRSECGSPDSACAPTEAELDLWLRRLPLRDAETARRVCASSPLLLRSPVVTPLIVARNEWLRAGVTDPQDAAMLATTLSKQSAPQQPRPHPKRRPSPQQILAESAPTPRRSPKKTVAPFPALTEMQLLCRLDNGNRWEPGPLHGVDLSALDLVFSVAREANSLALERQARDLSRRRKQLQPHRRVRRPRRLHGSGAARESDWSASAVLNGFTFTPAAQLQREREGAERIQRMYRCHAARCRAARLRLERVQQVGLRSIAAVSPSQTLSLLLYCGSLSDFGYREYPPPQQEDDSTPEAATTIQSVFRGHRARRAAQLRREFVAYHRAEAGDQLRRVGRGTLSRGRLFTRYAETLAAVHRCMRRAPLEWLRDAAYGNSQLQLLQLAGEEAAAEVLQRAARGLSSRRALASTRAAPVKRLPFALIDTAAMAGPSCARLRQLAAVVGHASGVSPAAARTHPSLAALWRAAGRPIPSLATLLAAEEPAPAPRRDVPGEELGWRLELVATESVARAHFAVVAAAKAAARAAASACVRTALFEAERRATCSLVSVQELWRAQAEDRCGIEAEASAVAEAAAAALREIQCRQSAAAGAAAAGAVLLVWAAEAAEAEAADRLSSSRSVAAATPLPGSAQRLPPPPSRRSNAAATPLPDPQDEATAVDLPPDVDPVTVPLPDDAEETRNLAATVGLPAEPTPARAGSFAVPDSQLPPGPPAPFQVGAIVRDRSCLSRPLVVAAVSRSWRVRVHDLDSHTQTQEQLWVAAEALLSEGDAVELQQKEESDAAVRIQAAQRGRQGRAAAKARRDSQQRPERHAALAAGAVVAAAAASVAVQEEMRAAAVRIQAMQRGRAARAEAAQRAAVRATIAAALVSAAAAHTQHQDDMDAAAARIQAVQRGGAARREAAERKRRAAAAAAAAAAGAVVAAIAAPDRAEEDAAAVRIQAAHRAAAARREADAKRRRVRAEAASAAAAVAVAAVGSVGVALEQAAAALRIQSAQRSAVARKEATRRRIDRVEAGEVAVRDTIVAEEEVRRSVLPPLGFPDALVDAAATLSTAVAAACGAAATEAALGRRHEAATRIQASQRAQFARREAGRRRNVLRRAAAEAAAATASVALSCRTAVLQPEHRAAAMVQKVWRGSRARQRILAALTHDIDDMFSEWRRRQSKSAQERETEREETR